MDKSNNKPMTLLEIFEHMNELADSGMTNSDAFDKAHDQYIHRLSYEDITASEFRNAIDFLGKNDISELNSEYMIEELSDKITESKMIDALVMEMKNN